MNPTQNIIVIITDSMIIIQTIMKSIVITMISMMTAMSIPIMKNIVTMRIPSMVMIRSTMSEVDIITKINIKTILHICKAVSTFMTIRAQIMEYIH